MATTIGRVDFIVGLDGRAMPSEARALGHKIGQALGAAAAARSNKVFGDGFGNSPEFEAAGKRLGERLANGLGASFRDRFQTALGDNGATLRRAINARPAMDDIGELIDVTERAGTELQVFRVNATRAGDGLRDAASGARAFKVDANGAATAMKGFNGRDGLFRRISLQIRSAANSFRRASREGTSFGTVIRGVTRVVGRLFTSFDGGKFVSMLGDLNDGWKGLTHGVRQAIFYVALFASLATQIAVLGSAAGVALTVLAGALVAVALAGGAAVLLFQGLDGEISELDPAIQPAVAALRQIGDAFGFMQEQIQASVLPSLIPAFEGIRDLVLTMTPGMVALAGAVGKVIDQMVNMLLSTNGLDVLNGLIAGAAPIFELLGSALLNLGGALGNIFLIAQPYIITFAGWLNDLFTRFNEWTQSIGGNTALQEWFENGFTVLSALGDLIGQVADFMAQLVTPDTIQGLLDFMTIIGGALQPLGDFLLALERFQIFNIIAQLISTVFTALQPLMPAFAMLGGLISGLLLVALQALTPILTVLVEAFAALVEPLIGALMPILPLFAELIGQAAIMFMPLLDAIVLLAATIGEAFAPVLTTLVDLFFRLIEALMPILAAILPPLTEIIVVLAQVIGETLGAVLPLLIDALIMVFDAFLPIIPTVVELIAAILELITPLLELIGPVLPPLMELLKFLVSASIVPLTAAVQFLTPVIKGLADGISSFVMPIIEGLKQALKGLGDFISGVFSGNLQQAGDGLVAFFGGIGSAIIGGLQGMVNGAVDIINGLINGINNLTGAVGIPGIPNIPHWAKGGIAWQSMIANIGEDGPEMVIPLRRPLHMIDPAVRDVAAYAQGKSTGNGGGGGDTNITIEEGAIQIVGPDARKAAVEVVDRIIEVAA